MNISENQVVGAFVGSVRAMCSYKEKEDGDFEVPNETIDWQKLEQEENERYANHILSVYSEVLKHSD